MKVFSLFFLIISPFCFSQISDEEQIKATINDLFLGMRTSDPVLVKRSLTKGAAFHSLDMDGKFYTDSPEQFAEQIGKAPKGSLDEKATSWKISIDGKMANAWVPYVFYYKNAFSHCGVDNFALIKENDAWKIHYLIYTMRKDKCEK